MRQADAWLFYFFSNTSWGLSQPAVAGLLDPRSTFPLMRIWLRPGLGNLILLTAPCLGYFVGRPILILDMNPLSLLFGFGFPTFPCHFWLLHTLKVLWEPLDDSFVQMIALLPWLIPCLLVYVLRWMSLSLCLLGFGLAHPKKNEFSLSRKEYRMTRDSIPYQS
jgi:hypothetical protein